MYIERFKREQESEGERERAVTQRMDVQNLENPLARKWTKRDIIVGSWFARSMVASLLKFRDRFIFTKSNDERAREIAKDG